MGIFQGQRNKTKSSFGVLMRNKNEISWNVLENEATPNKYLAPTEKEYFIGNHNLQGALLICSSILFALLGVYFAQKNSSLISTEVMPNSQNSSPKVSTVKLDRLNNMAIQLKEQLSEKKWFQAVQVKDSGHLILVLSKHGLFLDQTTQLDSNEKDFLDLFFVRNFLADHSWNFLIAGHSENRNNDTLNNSWLNASKMASAIAQLLVETGFYHKQIRTLSLGHSFPRTPTTDVAGETLNTTQLQNDRIEILIGTNFSSLHDHY